MVWFFFFEEGKRNEDELRGTWFYHYEPEESYDMIQILRCSIL